MNLKEFKDNQLAEMANMNVNPSPLLMFRRRGVRMFPDGQSVALYTNDKFNLTIMVPYGKNVHHTPIMAQGTMEEEFTNVFEPLTDNLVKTSKAVADAQNYMSKKRADRKIRLLNKIRNKIKPAPKKVKPAPKPKAKPKSKPKAKPKAKP